MDEGISKNIPSNEEIIDELTKNLEDSCLKMDSDEESNNIIDNEEEENENGDEKYEKNESETKECIDPFFVNEEELKIRDLNLSNTEKEAYKNEAEELKLKGNSLFKEGSYKEATDVYTLAIRTLPLQYSTERAILYANRAASKNKFILEKEIVISDCTKAIELNPNYIKAYLRRAQLYEESEKLNEALEDFKKVLSFDPQHVQANCAVRRLGPIIEEQNEKMKKEMLGKLKDLGNVFLKPFGLSTNNFELEPNPDSGGYTVKFKQNPT